METQGCGAIRGLFVARAAGAPLREALPRTVHHRRPRGTVTSAEIMRVRVQFAKPDPEIHGPVASATPVMGVYPPSCVAAAARGLSMGSPSPMADGAMDAPWSGRIELGPGWARFVGNAGDNRAHRHHAVQLVIGEGAEVRASIEGAWFEAAGLLIGTDVDHAVQPGPARMVYVESESPRGKRLNAACKRGVRVLTSHTCGVLHDLWHAPTTADDSVTSMVRELTGAVNEHAKPSGLPSRVQALIDSLPLRVQERFGIEELAAECQISPSRFAHVFKAQTGMAVRPYVRWLRLTRALDEVGGGRTLTAAAHAAGFADAAHFSRTMRRHFGIAPTAIVSSLRRRAVPDVS